MAYAQVPVPIQMQVGAPAAPSSSDGTLLNMQGGRQGDLYVDELYGRHYHQNYRGKVYHATTAAAGVVIGLNTTTTPVAVLWNPAGSGVNLVLIAAYYGYVSTTGAAANMGYAFQTNCGATPATGAPVLTFTNVAPNSGNIGGSLSGVSLAKWAPATCTITAASTYLGTNGISQLVTTATTTSLATFTAMDVFDGTVILGPGAIFHPISANAAQLSVWDFRLVWAEIPV